MVTKIIRYSPRRPGKRRCSKQLSHLCRKQRGWWPLDGFQRGGTNTDGLHSHCKDCRKALTRQWRKKNKKHIAAYQLRWREKNPELYVYFRRQHYLTNTDKEKAARTAWRKKYPIRHRNHQHKRRYRLLTAGGSITDADWDEVLNAYGHRCLRCGCPDDLTIDHVIPIPHGPNNKTNVQPLCRGCNSSKKGKTTDYRPDKGRRWQQLTS